ncbi:VOC family protein [Paenibacillus sp. TAB 01]|uniref:VOC family protein n=1 Tax=Paenibacillus sp. TAB 01 TaxID=3368988 RepID=UPI003752F6A4
MLPFARAGVPKRPGPLRKRRLAEGNACETANWKEGAIHGVGCKSSEPYRRDASKAAAFYKAAFGAAELYRLDDDKGKHIVGEANFWIQDDSDWRPETAGRSTVRMILTVDDPDAMVVQAIGAGAPRSSRSARSTAGGSSDWPTRSDIIGDREETRIRTDIAKGHPVRMPFLRMPVIIAGWS